MLSLVRALVVSDVALCRRDPSIVDVDVAHRGDLLYIVPALVCGGYFFYGELCLNFW